MTTRSQRYALLGIRLPLKGDLHNGRLIVDADNHAVLLLMPTDSATLDRDRSAAIVEDLNRGATDRAADEAAERDAA